VRPTRRSFLIGLNLSAAGLALGFYRASCLGPDQRPRPGLHPNVFIEVDPSGLVTVVCHRSEMGQGVRSSLACLYADELGADLSRIKLVQADGDEVYGDQNTDGSSSIRKEPRKLRLTAATVRTMLIAAAAKRWGVGTDLFEARDHAVFHRVTGDRLGFGELAAEAGRLSVPNEKEITLRPESDLRLVGKAMPLLDSSAYVNGSAQYGADVRVPGMLIAVIARPPVVGGRVVTYDPADALKVAGVRRVIALPRASRPYGFKPWGGVAVLADNTWAAIRGRSALKIVWDHGENAVYDSSSYREGLTAAIRAPGKALRSLGDAERALGSAARVVDAEYHVPHLAHVPMEPPAALARIEGDVCDVWACTQNPQAARKEAAGVLGWSQSKVHIHVTFLGGGFGRKAKADFVAEAVFLAEQAKAPVRVQWTREDDLQHDFYNSVNSQKLTAGLDDRNQLIAWRHRTAFPPIASLFVPPIASFVVSPSRPAARDLQQGVLDLALAVPNILAEACEARAYVRIGWLRAVSNIFHAFAEGCFVDELAQTRGVDPRQMWLDLLGPPRKASLKELGIGSLENYGSPIEDYPVDVGRLRHVIERVTDMSGWSERKVNGRSLGLAAHRSFLSYVAVVASGVTDAQGRFRIDEAWLAADAGQLVNPDRVHAQMEGAVIFGISHTLYGGATMKGGVTQQSNFHDYKLARMPEVPKRIHVELVSSIEAPGGVGEPGVPPVAPAIANALFALTGKRVRAIPLKDFVSV
jgi:isoquinoline 1-oxidoreductase beta subunit